MTKRKTGLKPRDVETTRLVRDERGWLRLVRDQDLRKTSAFDPVGGPKKPRGTMCGRAHSLYPHALRLIATHRVPHLASRITDAQHDVAFQHVVNRHPIHRPPVQECVWTVAAAHEPTEVVVPNPQLIARLTELVVLQAGPGARASTSQPRAPSRLAD